jgi:hypothetical protein
MPTLVVNVLDMERVVAFSSATLWATSRVNHARSGVHDVQWPPD